jgi:ATP synthase protein I
MSSRTENDDPWLGHVLRTADCGPCAVLPPASARSPAGMKTGPQQPGQGGAPDQEPRPPRESDGWQILSYMLGGMILYGAIGWLVSHLTGISVFFPLGMIFGIGLSISMIIFRFTRT